MTDVVSKFIPLPELDLFFSLRPELQKEVREKLWIIDEIKTSDRSLAKSAKVLASKLSGKKRYSESNIRTLWYKFQKDGWQGLINKAKLKGGAKKQLPLEFIEFLKDLCLDHQRGKFSPAYRKLLEMWADDRYSIPGYGTWRQYWADRAPGVEFSTCPKELPAGWDERNLRRYRPKRLEQQFANHGIAAGLQCMPHIPRTRVGLKPFEWVAFDDAQLDFMITVPGVDQPVRLAGLFAKDVATDMWLGFVLRPVIPRADGKKDGLKKEDMKRLCAGLIMKYGYPVDYIMNWVFERGTATLPEAEVRAIKEITGGSIIGHPTTMFTGKALLSGFADKAKGKARAKGWVESGFNRLHNEFAMIEGQKGLSYQAAPMELETRTKFAAKLLEAGQIMKAEDYLNEAIPFMDLAEAEKVISEGMSRINMRHDHNLEGFDKVRIWQLNDGDPWRPAHEALKYPVEMRTHFRWNVELESPFQRMARLKTEHAVAFAKVPMSALPHILAEHKLVTVENSQIKIKMDNQLFTFFDQDCLYLEDGRKFLAYYDSRQMDFIYLTEPEMDANGKLLGAFKCRLRRYDRIRQGDLDAAKKAIADQNRALGHQLAVINSRESRLQKTERRKWANQKALDTLEEIKQIHIAPDNHVDVVEASPVAAGLTAAQRDVQHERKADADFDPLDYFADLDD